MYTIFGINFAWVLLIAIAVIGFIVQSRLQSVFSKYSKVMFPGGLTGRDIAEKMLRDNGINDVKVLSTPGKLSDHYDPRNRTVNLSQGVYDSNSIAAAAVAAHECGHAIQHATSYKPMELRSALVPVITFSSRWAIWVILGGIILIQTSQSYTLFWIGILMIALSALFSIITLPVEYNASHRAMKWLTSTGMLSREQVSQAKTSLTWAARTYLVAALSAVVTLIFYLTIAMGRRR